MRYAAVGCSDRGPNKTVNQDSLLIRRAGRGKNRILMAIICDGVGGLDNGDMASRAVIEKFDNWFLKDLPHELKNIDMNVIGEKWVLLLKTLNLEIQECARGVGEKRGTTFTGALFVGNQLLVVHIGDTRFYCVDSRIEQLSQDHTFVAREVMCGRLTPQEAKVDKRRNLLLQCVGASQTISPQIIHRTVGLETYLICSDGFRHKASEDEMCNLLKPGNLTCRRKMRKSLKYLIDLNRQRGEKDDISAVVISPIHSLF